MNYLKTKCWALQDLGSLCYKHISEKPNRKQDDRSQIMILTGFHSTCANKYFSSIENKAMISRDVQFDDING